MNGFYYAYANENQTNISLNKLHIKLIKCVYTKASEQAANYNLI